MVGLTITAATENNSGGVLTLNGVSICPGRHAGLTISDMMLTEAGGRDRSTIVPGADIGVAMTGDTEGAVKLVTHDGLTMTAREGGWRPGL